MHKSKLFQKSEVYKPFAYPWAIEYTVEHEKMHWGEWEGQLQEDVNQWKSGKISKVEKDHIRQILRLFTHSDVAVGGNYCDVFIHYFQNNEIRQALLSTANREGTHQRAYDLLNATLGMDDSEHAAFLQFKEMKEKAEFMQASRFEFPFDTDYDRALCNIGYAIAQTICNEGMSLFSAFAMLLNYQRTGKMKGMCEIVEWSIRDETQHVDFMLKVFRAFCEEHRHILTDEFKKEIYDMYRQAVALEDSVIDLTYSAGAVAGLSKDEVKQYVRYLADRRLIQLGLKPHFKVVQNPLGWLEWITSATSFKNFFEGRVTDYSKAGMTGDMFGPESKEYIIYGRSNCPKCVSAKEFLKQKNVDFEYRDLTMGDVLQLEKLVGRPILSVPQITVDGAYLGGYDELVAAFTH